MKMPAQSRRQSVASGRLSSAPLYALSQGGISMSGCDKFKKLRCAGKIGLCIDACGFPPSPACLVCLGSLGECCDCVPAQYRQYCN
jgi:hypothetical protein